MQWLGDGLRGKKITKEGHDAVIDGLTESIYSGDESMARKAIDFLPLEQTEKKALQEGATALLKALKGEAPKRPEAPHPGMPERQPETPQKAPGEKIFRYQGKF